MKIAKSVVILSFFLIMLNISSGAQRVVVAEMVTSET